MTWYYKGEVFDPPEEELKPYAAFVYVITDKSTNKKYVGKKFFWKKKTLPPLKGKKNKRRSQVLSDWKEYYGSSDLVKELKEEHGPENFHREILHLCKTRGEAGFLEAKEQFDRNVLLDDSYYNGIINCRVHQSHVAHLKEKKDDDV